VSLPEILLLEMQDESPTRKTIEAIKRSGEKAAAIVQDLLTLARRGVSVSNPININTIVNDYLKSPEYTKLKEYHPHIHVESQLDKDLLNIMGSNIHLSKTIMNLITNAMEAMPKEGELIISTENRYLEVPIQGYDLIEKGEYAVLSIRDTGTGISQDDIKRIFEPFYSKKVMGRSGTGLGMAVIWSTVKDHRGFIDVESKVGVGTRFDLYFPSTREEIVDHGPMNNLDLFRGSEKVLVVDDMPDQQDIARRILEKLGYAVTAVSSGEEAIKYLRNGMTDLVILDMIMSSEMDGLDTYKNILKINPSQRAIIVSGYSETDRVRDALSLGAGAYVKKPYLIHEIARAVRIELDKKV
jgi:CheY-like chemotaxis protein